MKNRNFILLVCSTVLLSSCLKDELPVPMHVQGEGRVIDVCLGSGYQNQLWMDLGTGSVVNANPRSAWELAFESAPQGWHIMLNGSRMMTAWNLGPVDITLPSDTVGMFAARMIDAPSGTMDSTAVGDWRGNGDVHVIDLGYSNTGEWLGTKKISITSVNGTGYDLRIAEMNGTGLMTANVPKDPTRAFTCYSFNGGVVPIEPSLRSWDLVLTQFTHIFYDLDLPYLVTGMLSAQGTRVARLRSSDFGQVSLSDTISHPFSSRRDAIGYDWKTYSFETSSYTVDPEIVYIVEDTEGYFHKMHFLDFYGPLGQTGCPRFEVIGL